MTISKARYPRERSASTANATVPMMIPPGSSGMPNSRYRATAPPITSARSVAMATNSACTHMHPVHRSGQAFPAQLGRLRPVARPSFAVSVCTSIAIRFATTTTQTSR